MAVVVTKRKRFSSVLTFSKKKTNRHRTLYLDPQRTVLWSISVMVARNSMNIPKYTLASKYLFQMEGGDDILYKPK